jgi:hypothetical protein
MSKLIKRLDYLQYKAFDVVGWEDYVSELTASYFKLRAVVKAAEVLARDPESGLKVHALWGALAALEGEP